MPKLINGETLNGDISVTKQSGTKIMLDTDNTFVEKNIELTINVQSGSASTPNTSITADPTLSINSSTGVVTANVTATKSVTPTVNAGYVSTGSAGTMTVSGSNTLSLSTQAAQTITPGTANQTIAAGKYLTGAQTIAGDSNLVAANIAEGVSIFGVTGTHSGGGADPTDFIENHDTWTSYENSSATKIVTGTFYSCIRLTSVSFPACTSIGNYAFCNCSNLTSVSFPACTSIGDYAFGNCNNLKSVSSPACTSIGSYAFGYCSNLTSVSFPECTSISKYEFYHCIRLTSVSFPACTSIGDYAFGYCSNLTSVSFPACTSIGIYAFSKCFNLISIYLIGSSFVTLANSNAFSSTPIAGYATSTGGVYGSIYVPASMLESYKTRTNWTYFSNRMVGV